MTIMKRLRIGIATKEQYKARTIAIAAGKYKPAVDEPKIWFPSLESLAKVLSDKNRELLALIARTSPSSLNELSLRTGRAKSNLSRTLHTMERYGLVKLEKGEGRQLAPRVDYTNLEFEVSL